MSSKIGKLGLDSFKATNNEIAVDERYTYEVLLEANAQLNSSTNAESFRRAALVENKPEGTYKPE